MIFVRCRVDPDNGSEPRGFNCGPSDEERAKWIAAELRRCVDGVNVQDPELVHEGRDCIVTVMCPHGTLALKTMEVEEVVATWRALGRIG